MEKLDKTKKEKIGWMILAEKSMEKILNNKKDEEVWSRFSNNQPTNNHS